MNIVLLPSSYYPAVGGVEVLTSNLASTLRRGGHSVEVWTYSHTGHADVEIIDETTIRRFDFVLPSRAAWGLSVLQRSTRTLLAMRHAAAEFRPDVFHVQCFSGNGAYGVALAVATRRPLIVTLQGETIMDDQQIYEHSLSLRLSLRLATRLAFATTACSDFALQDAIQRVNIRPRRTNVIYNGVPLDVLEEPVGIPERPYFVALGRVVPNKGFDLLLDAFRRFASEERDIDLVIGGIGPALESLRHLTAEWGLNSRVHFAGPLSSGQVATVLRSSLALIVPSRVEPFGIVVLEGWRAGVPVVATSIGGPREFVEDGISGYLVDPHNVTSLADRLQLLSKEPQIRTTIGAAGEQRLTDFSWERIASEYESVYRSAIEHGTQKTNPAI